MDGDKAILAGSGIKIPRHCDRYQHDDNFGLSLSPPPVVDKEPPKFTIRKSKFYSLLGHEHSPAIPEEGPAPSQTSEHKNTDIPSSDEAGGVHGLRRVASTPSLRSFGIEVDNNKVSGEIMRHQLNAIMTERHDIASPHGSIDTGPSNATVLKMFEKASKRTSVYRKISPDISLLEKDYLIPKSQSVPVSPNPSPKPRRRHLSSDSDPNNMSGQKTITAGSTSVEELTSHVDMPVSPKLQEVRPGSGPITQQAVKFLQQWGTGTRVDIKGKDLNMFAPTSS